MAKVHRKVIPEKVLKCKIMVQQNLNYKFRYILVTMQFGDQLTNRQMDLYWYLVVKSQR